MSNEDGLNAALTDVRRAYRLLWAYQKRMIAYNRVVLDRLNLDLYYVNYTFGRPTVWNPDTKWVWDLLPFSMAGLLSYAHGKEDVYPTKGDWDNYPRAGDMLLNFQMEPDSGLGEAVRTNRGEPNPGSFQPVEECTSSVSLYLYVNRRDRNEKLNWLDIVRWNRDLPEHGTTMEMKKTPGVDVYRETWNLLEIPDEDSLIAKIDQYAEEASRKLKIKLPVEETQQ